MHCNSIVKKKINILSLTLSPLSLISLIFFVLFSLFLLCFSICSLIFALHLLSHLSHFFEWVCSGGSGDDFFFLWVWMGLLRWLRWWFFFNGFAPVMIVFEWVWMGLLRWWFFLNGFEWACSGDDFFDRWPGVQIGSVGFRSVA